MITRGLRQGEYISYYNNMICACPGFLLAADTSGIIIQTGRNADYSYRAVRISADIDRKFNEMMPLPARIMNHVYNRKPECFSRRYEFTPVQIKEICLKFRDVLRDRYPETPKVNPTGRKVRL